MSLINRLTVWGYDQDILPSQLNGEFDNIVNLFNNLDSGVTVWDTLVSPKLNADGGKVINVANGTVATDAATYGQLQYLQKAVQFVDTASSSTTSSTYASTTTTVAITPTASSSRIKISVTGTILHNGTGAIAFVSIFRGSTDLSNGSGFVSQSTGVTGNQNYPVSITFIDSPATTSATTYTVKIRNSDNSSNTVWNVNTGSAVIVVEELR